jgi:hypothetical protein
MVVTDGVERIDVTTVSCGLGQSLRVTSVGLLGC